MPKNLGFASLFFASALAAQCLPTPGVAIAVGQDSISGPHAIGFAFPLFGATYTDISFSDHGICFFSNGNVPPPPPALPIVYTPSASSLVANGPVVCPFWSDTVPGAQGAFYVDAQPSVCTITWANVQSFGYAQPLMTFQMKLHLDGSIDCLYSPQVTNNSTYQTPADNAVIGISPGAPAVLGNAVDLSTSPTTVADTLFQLFPTAHAFDMAADSLTLVPTNPGWAVTWHHKGSGCAFIESYGQGCEGLELSSTPPILGTTWELTTTGMEPVSQIGFTLFAFRRANPPISFVSLGFNAPGCTAYLPLATFVAQLVGVNNGGSMTIPVQVPLAAPWLISQSFTNQSLCFSSLNPAGFSASNGLECTMGN